MLPTPSRGTRRGSGPADRLDKGHARTKGGRWPAWFDRLVGPAECLVESSERLFAETAGEWRARQGIEVAETAEPQLQERLQDRRIETQPLDRQRGKGIALAMERAIKIGLAVGITRQRPGGACGVGHSRPAGEVVPGKTLDDVGHQGAFARFAVAEQMAAASDVEQQTGIAAEAAGTAYLRSFFFGERASQGIDRHPGCVTVAPVGDRLKQSAVGLGIDCGREQIGHEGAGIGQPHVRAQACRAGVRIEGGKPGAAVTPGNGGRGSNLPVVFPGSRQSIGRKLGDPQRDDAFQCSTPRARRAFPRPTAGRSGCA